jgi:hypothetical protein
MFTGILLAALYEVVGPTIGAEQLETATIDAARVGGRTLSVWTRVCMQLAPMMVAEPH